MSISKELTALNRTEKAAIIQQALQKEGFRDAEIARLMSVSRTRVHNVNKKIESGVLNPLVTKAKKAVKSLLDGKLVGEMREVRGSDVLTAAKMVLDRADPITQKVESTHHTFNHELKETDRDRYKKLLGIIDAEFAVVEPKQIQEQECEPSAPSPELLSLSQPLLPSPLESTNTNTNDTMDQPVAIR
jgi:predicted XRE-type DNA-binding protein